MTPHIVIPVSEASQAGEARRAAARLAETLNFDATQAGKVALAVTELGNNLARHAQGGQILLAPAWAAEGPALDILSVDAGPGMRDVSECLRDGYSTGSGGTPGTGFGAVKRLSDGFSVYSVPGKGTVILSRVAAGAHSQAHAGPRPPFDVGAVVVAAPGEVVSGDAWAFRWTGGAHASIGQLMVADGLGHGPVAAEAADAATALFRKAAGTPSQQLELAHDALRSTRGAAVAIAALDAVSRTVTFAGAGNIAGRLLSGVHDRSLMSQHGTVGLQVRKLVDVQYVWPPHACLVLHSDGLTTRWNLEADARLLQCDPVVIAAWLVREHTRGRDDVTVVVVRLR